jgi:hypothetical protein
MRDSLESGKRRKCRPDGCMSVPGVGMQHKIHYQTVREAIRRTRKVSLTV